MPKVTLEKVLAIARAEVGYLEKRSNSNLDDKTENAGYNNWTKYARDLADAGYYNGNKNGYAWCDVFVDWLFFIAADRDATYAQQVICQTGPYGAGVGSSANYYAAQGRLHKDNPKIGDQIFFWNGSVVTHTGLVVGVDSQKVYTIEGNTSAGNNSVVPNGGGVFEKSYDINNSRIYRYGSPWYDNADAEESFRMFGVDLSSWQKGISLAALKNEGVEFVILRVGDGSVLDSSFDDHYSAAVAAGLPVGTYWFCRATTVEHVQAEAKAMIARLRGKDIRLPVYIDCEANALIDIGKRALTDIILAWASEIRNAGYVPGVYTTEYWLRNHMYLAELEGIERWIAGWQSTPPTMKCGMWQFGGDKVNYLRSKTIAGYVVDQNYLYKNYMEGDMKRFYTLADLKADENAKKYYLPTVEKLLEKGAGSKGGEGDETIIDMSEDFVRMLAILDKVGALDGEKAAVNAEEIAALVKVPTADEIAADIANRISNG